MVVRIPVTVKPRIAAGTAVVSSLIIGLFVSVAGMILINALLFMAATTLSVDSGDAAIAVRVRRQPSWRMALVLCENAVVLAFVALAFIRVPQGLIFYVGN